MARLDANYADLLTQHLTAQLESRESESSRAAESALDIARSRMEQRCGKISDEQLSQIVARAEHRHAELAGERRVPAPLYARCLEILRQRSGGPDKVCANVRAGLTKLGGRLREIPSARDELRSVTIAGTPSPELVARLQRLLDEQPLDGDALLRFLGEHAHLGEVMHEWSGVAEGYSIGVHTRRVLRLCAEQLPLFDLQSVKVRPGIDLQRTLRFALAVHDVGKAVAVEAGDTAFQHEFTGPLLRRLMTQWGFGAEEVVLAETLVDNDLIGQVLHPEVRLDPNEAAKALAGRARDVGMTPRDFFTLQALFYTSDAASYPSLRDQLFVAQADGKLEPHDARFSQLRTLLERATASDGEARVRAESARATRDPAGGGRAQWNALTKLLPARSKEALAEKNDMTTLLQSIRSLDCIDQTQEWPYPERYDPKASYNFKHTLLTNLARAVAELREKAATLEEAGILGPGKPLDADALIAASLMRLVIADLSPPAPGPLLESSMCGLGFTAQEATVASWLLVSPSFMDRVASGHLTLDEAHRVLWDRASAWGVPVQELLALAQTQMQARYADEPPVRALQDRANLEPASFAGAARVLMLTGDPMSDARALVRRQEQLFERLYATTGFRSAQEFRAAVDDELLAVEDPARAAEVEGARQIAQAIVDNALELRFHVRADKLEGILTDGYKNLHAGGADSIHPDLAGRNLSETSHMGLTPEELAEVPGEARPCYCLVGPSARAANLPPPPGYRDKDRLLQNGYGPVVIVLDPKQVADRLTWTPGDSSNRLQGGVRELADVRQHEPEAWDQTFIPWCHRDLMLPFVPTIARNAGSEALWRPESAVSSAFKFPSRLTSSWTPEEYFEGQLFGGFLANDILAVEFPREAPPFAPLLRQLRERGIEVRLTDYETWPPAVLPPNQEADQLH